MFLEGFSPYEYVLETTFRQKKFASFVFTNMFLLPLWDLENYDILPNCHFFAQDLWNFFDTVFTNTLVK